MASVLLAPIHTRLLNTWTMLAQSDKPVSHTGDTVETTLVTVALEAAFMGKNGILRMRTEWKPDNTSSKSAAIKLGGVSIFASTYTTNQLQVSTIFRNSDDFSKNDLIPNDSMGFAPLASIPMTIDTSVALSLNITGSTSNAAHKVILSSYAIELFYTA